MMQKGFKILLLLFCCHSCFAQVEQGPSSAMTVDTSWRTDPAFKYMNTLDSMLHVLNRNADSLLNISNRKVIQREKSSDGLARIFQNTIVKSIFWGLLIFLFLYILYSLFLRYRLSDKSLRDNTVTEVLEEEKLLSPDLYQASILSAEKENDYPMAVRYHFLNLLALLEGKNAIHFLPEKTNTDYISELSMDYDKTEFTRLIHIYEYLWYGNNFIDRQKYLSVKERFTQYSKNI